MHHARHLLNELIEEDDLRQGVFKLRSTISWAAALRFAVEERHGAPPEAQFDSCRRHFRQFQVKAGPLKRKGEVYCLLYHALTSATTLVSLDCGAAERPWMYPTAVVTWYYAHYHAFRAMALARGLTPEDTHASLQRTISAGLRTPLPHPYDMHAVHCGDGTYAVELPGAPGASPRPLVEAFDETSETAHGMLLKYLESTAHWERCKVEERIRTDRKAPYHDFRTRAARDARNAKLPPEINFMHCAFRYRGNANYRDPLYLTYGTLHHHDYPEFLHNLTVSARFAFLCGLAFVERAYGERSTEEFLDDLGRNFRGAEDGTEAELFWRSLRAGAPLSLSTT